ncbi:MAG TPA: formate hydrogenase, partial [Leptospiraceae bacterium]|nr:formate hydrogenase [Leptospiraceae bacterium]
IASILKMAALITLLMRIAFEHLKLSSLGIAGKFLEEIIMILGALAVPIMIGWWEAVSVRRKWEWIPEFMGMTLIFILALGTIVRL